MIKREPALPAKSYGIAMILTLIFLIILSGIGIYLAKRSSLDLRMAGNLMGKTQTFEQAEEARITAEIAANTLADKISAGGRFDCSTSGFFAAPGVSGTSGNCRSLSVKDLKWDNSDSSASASGQYVIEYQGQLNIVLEEDRFNLPIKQTEVHGFRIVTRGIEESGGRTVLETIYVRRASS